MPISQAEFARRRNVSRARVSQWVKAGKIFGPALVDGQIDEVVACDQLKVKLDIDQRLSGNGLGTNLEAADDTGSDARPPIGKTTEARIAEERLIGLERDNRRKATEEAEQLGLICDAGQARQATGREVARVVARFEGSLTEFASAIAAEFKIPHRDALHCLRGKWREVRQAAAIEARERAEPMPPTTGFQLEDA